MVIWLVAALGALQDDAYTVTLAFEKMHCDECKVRLEGDLKRLPGFKSSAIADNVVTVVFAESAAVPAFNRLPTDLKLLSATITIRGTATFSGAQASLLTKGGRSTLQLSNPSPQRDLVGEMKRSGKARFKVTGTLVGGRSIVLSAAQPAEWKD